MSNVYIISQVIINPFVLQMLQMLCLSQLLLCQTPSLLPFVCLFMSLFQMLTCPTCPPVCFPWCLASSTAGTPLLCGVSIAYYMLILKVFEVWSGSHGITVYQINKRIFSYQLHRKFFRGHYGVKICLCNLGLHAFSYLIACFSVTPFLIFFTLY